MRKPRCFLPDSRYHVTSRCANKEFFLKGREAFALSLLRRAARFSGVQLDAFALMGNHFHLLVRVPERKDISEDEFENRIFALYGETRGARLLQKWEKWEKRGDGDRVREEKQKLLKRMYDLTEFVKTFKESFSRAFNRETGHSGTVWEGRFHSVLVAREWTALFAVASYIDANPFSAGLVAKAEDYAFSSWGQARKGDAEAISGLVRLASDANGARLGEKEALALYEAQLEKRRPGAASGKLPAGVDLKRCQAPTKAEEPYCEDAALARGGAIGTAAALEQIAARCGERCQASQGEELATLRRIAGKRYRFADREGAFRGAA